MTDNLDLIWGAAAIAALIGKSERSTKHLLATNQVPGAKKVGRRWVVSRKVLQQYFEGREAA